VKIIVQGGGGGGGGGALLEVKACRSTSSVYELHRGKLVNRLKLVIDIKHILVLIRI